MLNNLYAVTTTTWEADDYAIADKVSSYWANFIKTGNPNTGGSYAKYGKGALVNWPESVGSSNTTFNI